MKQQTIRQEVSISGIGIHTGKKSTLKIFPAKENTGIIFQRTDLPENPKVTANFKNVSSTKRGTNIKYNNTEIKTIEHLMASISAHKISKNGMVQR